MVVCETFARVRPKCVCVFGYVCVCGVCGLRVRVFSNVFVLAEVEDAIMMWVGRMRRMRRRGLWLCVRWQIRMGRMEENENQRKQVEIPKNHYSHILHQSRALVDYIPRFHLTQEGRSLICIVSSPSSSKSLLLFDLYE